EVTCPETDLLIDLAARLGLENGIYGARMTGGGFGGSTVTLADREKAPDAARRISAQYEEQTGIRPSWFVTRPAAGAHLIEE
ncbi:MAG: galactokinase, partial [Thermoguttaceae bacterium]|nr:galactokinase [Thermoguttaceae bacterium]